MENRQEFVKHLLSQDPPSTDIQSVHRDALVNAIKRRIWLEKVVTGSVYVLIFAAAFLAFLQRRQTASIVHAICWGALSLHILLWFLVYFLWRIRALLRRVPLTALRGQEDCERVRSERKTEIATIVLFAFTTLLVVGGFRLTDPLDAAQMTTLMLWGPTCLLFYFAFRTASRASNLWIEFKKLEVTASDPEDEI